MPTLEELGSDVAFEAFVSEIAHAVVSDTPTEPQGDNSGLKSDDGSLSRWIQGAVEVSDDKRAARMRALKF